MGIVIGLAKSVGEALISALLTKKVVLKLIVIGIEKLKKSDSTGPEADQALEVLKQEIEKQA